MDLPLKTPKRPGRPANNVLRVSIFRRKGSKYLQAQIRRGKWLKRITTRTLSPAAAKEFAELAYRQYSREQRGEPRPAMKQPVQEVAF
jgi:hypothetical protein